MVTQAKNRRHGNPRISKHFIVKARTPRNLKGLKKSASPKLKGMMKKKGASPKLKGKKTAADGAEAGAEDDAEKGAPATKMYKPSDAVSLKLPSNLIEDVECNYDRFRNGRNDGAANGAAVVD